MRISPRLVRLARKSSPQAIALLRAAGGLEAAQNELRWIKNELPKSQWSSAIARRARLEPLQYILGTQPFGSLEILCEAGVLIPRWETEEWATKLADLIREIGPVNAVDACTGTGCTPLLLKHEAPESTFGAFDISETAVSLARKNAERLACNIAVVQGDVFDRSLGEKWHSVDLVTANPPYIPKEDYDKPLALDGPEKSVRMYEPRLALVGHVEFYSALMTNLVLPLECSGFVFELGYEEQVEAVARMAPDGWKTGRYYDSAGRLRCVVGWRERSRMAVLEQLACGTRE